MIRAIRFSIKWIGWEYWLQLVETSGNGSMKRNFDTRDNLPRICII